MFIQIFHFLFSPVILTLRVMQTTPAMRKKLSIITKPTSIMLLVVCSTGSLIFSNKRDCDTSHREDASGGTTSFIKPLQCFCINFTKPSPCTRCFNEG